MDRIIIAVGLGHFKAYRVTKTPTGNKIDLIESYDSVEAHGKLFDRVTDQAGRFKLGGGKGAAAKAKGYGEPHNFELETEKKLIKMLAKDINSLITREKSTKWHLAAAKNINNQIVENLEPAVKSRLDKNITVNLTNTRKAEIAGYFEQ